MPSLPPLCALAALLLAIPLPASAQFTSDTSALQILRRVVEERWIHEGRRAEWVPLERSEEAVELREVVSDLPSRLRTRSWLADLRGIDARVSLDSLGSMRALSVRPAALDYFSTSYDARRHRADRIRRLRGPTGVLRLPSSRFREIWLALPQGELPVGESWTDTLAFTAEPGEGLRESYEAVRRHRVVGDTVVDGRRVPWIRTEADVRYASMDVDVAVGEATVEHELGGRLTGMRAVDPRTGLPIAGADTAVWEGPAILDDPSGPPVASTVRYERFRTLALYDSTAWAARRDSLRAERRRGDTGMLILPTSDLEARLRDGDVRLLDSLVARWRATLDAAEAREIVRLLSFPRPRDALPRERFDSLERVIPLEKGDTVAALRVARRRLSGRGSLTRADAELLLPYLEDRARLWRLGERARYDYVALASLLLRATPLLEPDSARWGCEPSACRMFLDRPDPAAAQGLWDARLVGLFARDPARWYDSLVVRQEEGSLVVEEGVRLGRGVPREGAPPVPGPGEGWESWRAWWGAPNPRGDHRGALRLHAARTGRDALAELMVDWPPEGDSARTVFGEILRSVGRLPPRTAEEVRRELLSGDPGRVRRATAELRRVGREGEAVPPDVAAPLLAPLVDSIFARGEAPWPAVEGVRGGDEPLLHPSATSSHGVRGVGVFVLEENLPEAVLADLPAGVARLTAQAWEARDPRAGGHAFRFRPVLRWGAFVSIGWEWTAMERREPDEAPMGFAGGGNLVLVETEEGWRVALSTAWIT